MQTVPRVQTLKIGTRKLGSRGKKYRHLFLFSSAACNTILMSGTGQNEMKRDRHRKYHGSSWRYASFCKQNSNDDDDDGDDDDDDDDERITFITKFFKGISNIICYYI